MFNQTLLEPPALGKRAFVKRSEEARVGVVWLPGYGVCLDTAVWLFCSRDAVCQMKNYSAQEQRDSPELLQAPKNLKPNLACPPWAG